MNSANSKNNDSLQQMIIVLETELATYKTEVKKYHDSHHYSSIDQLQLDNEQLITEKNELYEDLYRANKEIIKRASDYKEQSFLLETQNKKLLSTNQTLQKNASDLQSVNNQLSETIQQLKDGYETKLRHLTTSLHNTLAENKLVKERFEEKIARLVRESYNQLHSQIVQLDLTNQERGLSDKLKQHLLNEIEQKNHFIVQLQQKIAVLQKKMETNPRTITIDNQELMHVDRQIKKLLAQSSEFEERLDAKFKVINALDDELNQLITEINKRTILSPLLNKS